MGLFRGLALLPLAPVGGVVWIARQIQTEVDRQILDPESVIAELERMQAALDEGRLSEAEYQEIENELLDRLEATGSPQ
jgi:hypothetical protein